jgi:HK97 family phage major capsid protein
MSSAPTESNPKFNGIKLTVKELMGLCKLSRNIRADAVVDLGNMIAEEFAYAFAVAEDAAGFTGDGTSTYGGIKGLTTYFSTTGGAGGGQLVGAVDAASASSGRCPST